MVYFTFTISYGAIFFSVKLRSDWKQDYTMVNFRINGANLNQTMLNNQGKLIYFFLTLNVWKRVAVKVGDMDLVKMICNNCFKRCSH